MWSVVNFKSDNSVETVPSFWFKKDKCAWPKKNPTMFIKSRILPNKFDFEYLDARKIGKDISKNLNIYSFDVYCIILLKYENTI